MPWGTLLLVTPTYLYTGALNITWSEPPGYTTHNPPYIGALDTGWEYPPGIPYRVPLHCHPDQDRLTPTESPYIGARDLFTMPTNKLHKLILKFLIIIPKNIPHLELIFLKFQKNLNI